MGGRALAVVLFVLLPLPVLANDTAVGGFGSDLVPLASTKVRLKAEDILIRPVGKDWKQGKYWEVEADYTFENLTAMPVKLQVGFPEYACEGGDPGDDIMCDPKPLPFESMRTTVDGQPVVHRKGTIKKGHPWRPRLGQVWLYDVTFEPGRETKISHRYRVTRGEVSDGTALGYYVTRTGATWAGTIGHARFRIHVPVETRSVSVEPEPNPRREGVAAAGLTLTTQIVEIGGARIGEILLEARDWEPKTDLHFSFFANGVQRNATYELAELDRSRPITEQCPNLSALWGIGQERAEPNPGDRIPPGDPTEQDVERMLRLGLGSAAICSAYIYATYGKRFEDDALNRRFYGWDGWKPKGWPYGELQPNPEYSDAMLTPADRATLQLIRRVEDRITGKALPPAASTQAAAPVKPRASSPSEPRVSRTSSGTGGCGVHVALRASHRVPPALVVLVALVALRLARARARRSRGAA
jgi:hypothetical protein